MRKTILMFLISFLFVSPVFATSTFNTNLSYGASGPAVIDLQNFLATQGLYSGPISGNFYSLTKNALISFQKEKGIQPASGFLGPLTRAVINGMSGQMQVTTSTPSTPNISQKAASSLWADLESKYFTDASRKGWTSLTITNASGDKCYYRFENGTWVRKDTLAEAQQPVNTTLCNGTYWSACPAGQEFICATDGIKPYCQVHPPTATPTQIAGIALLCSLAASQGNSAIMQVCTDGTILNDYNTNAIFRNNIDAMVQQVQQKIAQQQAAVDNQVYLHNYLSFLSTQNQINQSFVNEQNALNAEAAAQQQQMQNAQILQAVQQTQQLLQQMANTPPAQTHCGIDAGVFVCKTY